MWARLRSWLRGVVSRGRVERDLADEMDFHLRARTDYWLRQGLPPNAAARRARIEFGGLEGYKDECRQAQGLRWIDELGADVSYGLRTMRAAPTFTIVSVIILAIAIGANTAVFSVVEAVMVRMLPVERPQDLRELAWVERRDSDWRIKYDGSARPFDGGDRIATSFAYPVYAQVRDRSATFADLFLFSRQEITAGIAGREHRVSGLLVSGNFFRGLGVKPMLGREIEPADDHAGAPPVAVLTYGLWQRMLGGDPAETLGRTLSIDGTPAVIVGVTPPSFYGVEPGNPIDVMAPITTLLPAIDGTHDLLGNSRYWGFRVMGRVRPRVDDERVQTETDALVRQALPEDLAKGDQSGLRRVLVTSGGQGLDSLRRNYARPLYLLMAIMVAVVLIASANIAGLLLTRAAAREHEMGLRLSLGATRARLMRQVLTESALLAAVGGTLGIGLAFVARNRLLPLLNQGQKPITLTLGVGPWLATFAAGLCVAVALLCGILPALRATRLGLGPVLKRMVSGNASRPSRLFAGKTLIALQVAISFVLLVGAGLFARTLLNLRSQAFGFRPDHVLLFQMDATAGGYEDTRLLDFYERVLDRVTAVPGVRAVALSRYGLLSGGATRDSVIIPGAPKGQDAVHVYVHYVSPRYFETMGIPLVAGRPFTTRDRDGAARVALVNQALARLLPGSGAPVGRGVLFDRPDSEVEIVGVTADARFASLRDPAPPTLYLPYRQYPQHQMTFAARVEGDPMIAAAPIRRTIDEVDPSVPMFEIRAQDAQIDTAMRQERIFAYVASGFAAFAVLLTCLGIYGTLAYSVARRTPEIGLRMALGADRWRVVYMVLQESLGPVLLGAAAGFVATNAATQLVQSMLFGLTPDDAPTRLLATLGLIASALVAAWLPSRRASGIDPMTALRRE